MIGYEDYLSAHPQVARSRAEKMLAQQECLFLKKRGYNLALLPENGSSSNLVSVYLDDLTCGCNVFRTKKACPHIAAALGFIEKNDGKIPYTDPVSHVYASLENLKSTTPGSFFFHSASEHFRKVVLPYLDLLPDAEKQQVLLQLAYCLQMPESPLTESVFLDCYYELTKDGKKSGHIAASLFQNRKSCYLAVAVLMSKAYSCPFTEKEKKMVLQEAASDDKLAAQLLPVLAYSYSSFFTREQFLSYFKKQDSKNLPGLIEEALLERLLKEDPPLFDEFFSIYNRSSYSRLFSMELDDVEKLIQAGYADRMTGIFKNLVLQIRNIDDYFQLIRIIPHEQFLSAWKEAKNENRYYYRVSSEVEAEIDFLEDPSPDPDDYYLEDFSCNVLEVIQRSRPEYRKSVNDAARKIYRKALKQGDHDMAKKALRLLVLGEDLIAVKYVSEWDSKNMEDTLVYIASVGIKFNCLQKLAPELTKLEVHHASRQDQ